MRLLSLCLLALLPNLLHAEATPAPTSDQDKLVGLWGVERVFGPAVQGALSIDSRNGVWVADVGGYQAPVWHAKNEINFILPGGAGSFHGIESTDGKRVVGFWRQPPGVTHDQAYATPLTLLRSQPGVWQGEVHPLSDQVSLYLVISRADDGSLKAFIRNPEFNFGMHRLYKVSLSGSALTLDDTLRKDDKLTGEYDA